MYPYKRKCARSLVLGERLFIVSSPDPIPNFTRDTEKIRRLLLCHLPAGK